MNFIDKVKENAKKDTYEKMSSDVLNQNQKKI